MAIKKVVTVPNEILESKCQKVTKFDNDLRKLGQDLVDTVENASNPEGAGLAAPQLGVLKRICVVRKFPEHYDLPIQNFVLVNPKIIERSKETDVDIEGCLSIPDVYGNVERHSKIKVKAQNLNGDFFEISANGFFGRVIQHEMDHLEGVLFTSKVVGHTYSTQDLEDMGEQEEIITE